MNELFLLQLQTERHGGVLPSGCLFIFYILESGGRADARAVGLFKWVVRTTRERLTGSRSSGKRVFLMCSRVFFFCLHQVPRRTAQEVALPRKGGGGEGERGREKKFVTSVHFFCLHIVERKNAYPFSFLVAI